MTEKNNENLTETQIRKEKDVFQKKVKQTCWSNEKTNFAIERKLNWLVLREIGWSRTEIGERPSYNSTHQQSQAFREFEASVFLVIFV